MSATTSSLALRLLLSSKRAFPETCRDWWKQKPPVDSERMHEEETITSSTIFHSLVLLFETYPNTGTLRSTSSSGTDFQKSFVRALDD